MLPRREGSGHVREAGLSQRARDLDVGIDASVDPAEHLEDQPVVEDEGGVRLLPAHGPDPRHLLLRRHPVQELLGQLGVEQAVVVEVAVDGAHHRAVVTVQELRGAVLGAGHE